MAKNEIIKKIGAKLRRDADDVATAPLPRIMQELVAKLEQLEQQVRPRSSAQNGGAR